VHIEKGARDGQKIVFYGKGDQQLGLEPGNVIIVLDELEHPVFKRKGHNLVMEMAILLSEALCGCTKTIETLDKRVLVFHMLPGEVIKHNDRRVIMGEGMPVHKSPETKGDLIVDFKVTFPEKILPKNVTQLAALLPSNGAEPLIPDDAQMIQLIPVTESMLRSSREEDEFQGGPQGVRCATQ
jgi:DnaJ family protein A protein 1